ncbi:hypothetical protein ABIF14_002684 [Bradyrhizobium elkanii]
MTTAFAAALAICWLVFKSLPRDLCPQLAGMPGDVLPWVAEPERKPWEEFIFFKKGGGGGSAPSPDPQIGTAAIMQAQTGQDMLDFAKQQFEIGNNRQADMDALSRKLIDQQYGISEQQQKWAQSDRERYESVYKPVEDKFIAEAKNYATPEKQAQAAAEARADVMNSAAAARGQQQRQMTSMGVNPNSGRFAGVDRATNTATALGAAGAQNAARTQVRDKGLALMADVANMGRGLPAQSAQATSLGLGAGQAAMGTAGAANQNFYNNVGVMNTGYGGAMKGYAGQGSTLNTLYGNQINAWSAQQQANAASSAGLFGGIGSLVGTGIGAFMSSKDVKFNKTKIAGALDAVRSMPVEAWTYKEGAGDEGEHIGPYAEDFQKATGLGDGKSINPIDAIGLGLKAVQELSEKVDKLADKKAAPKAKPRRRAVEAEAA